MRYELWIVLIAGLVAYDVHTGGKLSNPVLQCAKYFNLAIIAIVALVVMYIIHKTREGASAVASNEYAVSKFGSAIYGAARYVSKMPSVHAGSRLRVNNSLSASPPAFAHLNGVAAAASKGKSGSKRSVSETKKKFVASAQQWKCNGCAEMLDHTFEIDHLVRLEYGGTNETDNLIALCRNCHGKKTAAENMG